MNNNIKIDTEKLNSIRISLREKSLLINEILDDIDEQMKKIDGTTNVWQGKVQRSVYASYKSIADSFPKIKEELENFNKFLDKTNTNYQSAETSINQDIENNDTNLAVN